MMPSITSGVHSKPSSTPVWKVQTGISRGDVLGVDLLERAVAVGVVGAAVHQPVGVVRAGLQEVVVIDGPDRLGRRLLPRASAAAGSRARARASARGLPPASPSQAARPSSTRNDRRALPRMAAGPCTGGEDRCAHDVDLASPPEAPASRPSRAHRLMPSVQDPRCRRLSGRWGIRDSRVTTGTRVWPPTRPRAHHTGYHRPVKDPGGRRRMAGWDQGMPDRRSTSV